ncbi:MAG: type II toxin-antitoxin system HicA family toxin, partial [Bryobacterales bacterium]|nr:type II toxin-antitoxin system HicA family toxin [Bryobacterales bacterium]
MPKLPRWTAMEAERALLRSGFELVRSKGSHRIYGKGTQRVTVPFHSGEVLHPKALLRNNISSIECFEVSCGHGCLGRSSPPLHGLEESPGREIKAS